MVSTADHDRCKSVLNTRAIINEEDIVSEKIAFGLSQFQINRSLRYIFTNAFNKSGKLSTIGILSLCWFTYVTA